MLTPGLMKHRDYCGVITNHLKIARVVPATEEAIEELNEDSDHDVTYDELLAVGDVGEGEEWIVEVDWIHEGSLGAPVYTYRVFLPSLREPTEQDLKLAEDAVTDGNKLPDMMKMIELLHEAQTEANTQS